MTRRENQLAGLVEMSLISATMLEDGRDFNQDEVAYILSYFSSVLTGEPFDPETGKEILASATQYTKNPYIRGIGASLLGDEMLLLNIPMTTDEDDPDYLGEWRMDNEAGTFGYVYNLTYPDCSELGYMWFERKGGRFRRIS